ncbi:MAG: response regulator [Proteobacteria bacterium]|nr:response regulator [Pseudomonadota bacterium]
MIITYAIIRHRLWDIRTIIHKTAVWVALSVMLIVPLYFIMWAVAKYLPMLSHAELALGLTIIFLLGYAYLRAVKPHLDHLFQRRAYNRRNMLDRLAKEMAGVRATDEVIAQILDTLTETLYPESVSVLLRSDTQDGDDGDWQKFARSKGESKVGPVSLVPEDPFVQKMVEIGLAVERGQLEVDKRFADVESEAERYFTGASIQVCLPLVQDGSILGLIHLTEKSNLQPYSRGDLEFLEQLGVSASVGLSNSLLFEQVDSQRRELADFTGTLEVKVEDRTRELQEVNDQLGLANERLRDLDKMKSRLFANISHELRTPLTLILAPADSMLAGEVGELSADVVGQVTGIRRSALELLKHIEDLLDLSQLEEARMRVRIAPFDLKSHLIRIFDFARPLAERKKIEFVLKCGEDLMVKADEAKMERVFVNLLSNALKFTDNGGKITICVDRSDDKVSVVVEDTGIGIAKEDIELIFDRFGQVDPSITRRRGGSGIGLSLAKELVELHRGKLIVTSEPGRGSTFTVELPGEIDKVLPPEVIERRTRRREVPVERRAEDNSLSQWTDEIVASLEYRFIGIDKADEQKTKTPVKTKPTELKAARVLLVDDNPEVLEYLQISLQDRYDIWTAENGKEAWELLLEHRHDLVISDIMMPVMSGLELTHRIKKDLRTQDVPIILLTARGGAEHRVEGHAVGADQYFSKPFNPSELRAAIRSLLSGRSRRFEAGARRRFASMETLLGGMAHELHNACHQVSNAQTAIWTLARRILDQDGEPRPDQKKDLAGRLDKMEGISHRALERITKVVRSLEQYTRDQMQVPWKVVDMDALVAKEVELLPSAKQKGVELKLTLEAESVVRGPEEEIRQMVLNLIENAIHAVEPGGLVEVNTSSAPGKVLLSVSDNGCGISADKQDRIFDPFFTTKDSGQGMGLGLSLCKRTITDLGGEIELRSQEGVGTQMLVELPSASFGSLKAPPPIVAH